MWVHSKQFNGKSIYLEWVSKMRHRFAEPEFSLKTQVALSFGQQQLLNRAQPAVLRGPTMLACRLPWSNGRKGDCCRKSPFRPRSIARLSYSLFG